MRSDQQYGTNWCQRHVYFGGFIYFQYVCEWLLALLSTTKSQIYSPIIESNSSGGQSVSALSSELYTVFALFYGLIIRTQNFDLL